MGIGLAALALRSGLRLRRRRRWRGVDPEYSAAVERRHHLRIAKVALLWLALGSLSGPASMWWLRGRPPFETAHAYAGGAALLLFLAAGVLGRRLERNTAVEPRDWHAAIATSAVLAAALAFATGWVLLP